METRNGAGGSKKQHVALRPMGVEALGRDRFLELPDPDVGPGVRGNEWGLLPSPHSQQGPGRARLGLTGLAGQREGRVVVSESPCTEPGSPRGHLVKDDM